MIYRDKGKEYVRRLRELNGREISYHKLYYAVNDVDNEKLRAMVDNAALSDYIGIYEDDLNYEMIDAQTKRECEKRMRYIENKERVTREEREELEFIRMYLSRSTYKGKLIKTFSNNMKKIAKAVRLAIRRYLEYTDNILDEIDGKRIEYNRSGLRMKRAGEK